MPSKSKRKRRYDPFSWDALWADRADGCMPHGEILTIMCGHDPRGGSDYTICKTLADVETAWSTNRAKFLERFPSKPGARHGAEWVFEIFPKFGPRLLVCTRPLAKHHNYGSATPGGFPQECWESSIRFLDAHDLLTAAEREALGDQVEDSRAIVECRELR